MVWDFKNWNLKSIKKIENLLFSSLAKISNTMQEDVFCKKLKKDWHNSKFNKLNLYTF